MTTAELVLSSRHVEPHGSDSDNMLLLLLEPHVRELVAYPNPSSSSGRLTCS
jgi:hypothetical protein